MKKKNVITKIFVLISIILVIFFCISIANSFYGNPISKAIAAKEINDYVTSNYNSLNLIIKEPNYMFKFNEYWSNVYSNEYLDVHFLVINRDGRIRDNYEGSVLSGWNTKERMGEEYADLITPMLQQEFENSFSKVEVEYTDESIETDVTEKINKPLVVNDGEYIKLQLTLKGIDMTVKSLSNNLQKLHSLLSKEDYNINEYVLWIDGDEQYNYIYITGIKPEMIDNELTNLIQYSKDNKEEAFRKHGVNLHFNQ